MSDKKPENPSAFPSTTHTSEGHSVNGPEFGMSLRDYFAAHAELPWGALVDAYRRNRQVGTADPTMDQIAEYNAQLRYVLADAMLAEREATHA